LTDLKVLSNEKKGNRDWNQYVGVSVACISAMCLAIFKEPWLFELQKIGFSVFPIFVTVFLEPE